jgi:predicted nucleotidyltransferase
MNSDTDPHLNRSIAVQPYPLLFATISGAHLCGFPSPTWDFDLRGVHVLPLERVVGLEVRDETVEQKIIVPPRPNPLLIGCGEGGALEMDILSHDVRKFFGLLLTKNGYLLVQFIPPLLDHTTLEHAGLKEACRTRVFLRGRRGDEAHSSPENSQSLLTSAATGVVAKHHSHPS